MNIRQLTQLGLNKREASVYLACLELGSAKASEIAVKIKMQRDLCYTYLNSLVKKGLIKIFNDSPVKKFVPENPRVMVEKIEKKEAKLLEEKRLVEQAMGQLLPLYYGERKFHVTLFEGEEEREILRQDILSSEEKVRTIAAYDMGNKDVPFKEERSTRKFSKPQTSNLCYRFIRQRNWTEKERIASLYFSSNKNFSHKS